MSDQLRPVFPPDEPNLSREALNAANSLLDEDTQRILALDRARLVQTTAATALALTQSLELSPDTALEVQQALVGRVAELAPNYHHYINQLLGNSALTLADQSRERVYVQAEVTQPLVSVPEATFPMPVEGADTIPPAEVNAPPFDEADLMQFAPDFKLTDHEKPSKNAKRFILAVFGEDFPVGTLSAREVSLVACQLIDTYMTTPIPQASESRKANQKQRMELQFALYGPIKSAFEICEELGISNASFYTGLKRVESNLSALMTTEKIEEYVQKAKVTAEFGSEDLFVSVEQFEEESQQATLNETRSEEKFQILEKVGIVSSDVPVDEVEVSDTSIVFKEYLKAPANMINFLVEVYPPKYSDRLHLLEPWQASYLSYRLVEEYRSQLSMSAVPEDKQKERVLRLERWTGIYKNSQDYSEIATARVTSAQSVKNGIESSIERISKRVPREELDELFNQASAITKPRVASRVTT